MMKRLFVLLPLLFLLCLPLVAIGTSEATSEESWLITHTSVNNENKFWDISETVIPTTPEHAYSAASENGLLRIRTNFGREHTGDSFRQVTITPDANGWYFVSDNNITVSRPYSLDVYSMKWTRSSSTSDATKSGTPSKLTGNSISYTDGSISFTMTKATWTGEWSWDSWSYVYYSKEFYDYEILIRLPELTDQELADLEPGTYHATFSVTLCTDSEEGETITESFTIKGEYGASSSSNTEYSFMVDSVSSSYNVDLSSTDTYFDVAKVQFQAMGLSTENKEQENIESLYSNKYKVLISAYSNYELDTGSENPYYFVLNGTENLVRTEINTVYYSLAGSAGGSSLPLYNGNRYAHTYVLTPTLSVSGTRRNWVLSWELSKTIYLKPEAASNETITRAAGFYKTTLYFYVETN